MAAVLNDKYLRHLADKELGDAWESLATELDFTLAEIKTFRRDNHTTPDAIFDMLVKWKRKQPKEDSAVRDLIVAFERVRRQDLATHLKGR